MREGGENQHGGADHHAEHAKIKKECAGHMQFAEQRQGEVGGVAGQERIADRPGTQAGNDGNHQAQRQPAVRLQVQTRFHPQGAGQHVLDDDTH